MTEQELRDHFAAAALTGLLALNEPGPRQRMPDELIASAFRWADAMLAARGTEPSAPDDMRDAAVRLYDELREIVVRLYEADYWRPTRLTDSEADSMWHLLREALGIPPGTATRSDGRPQPSASGAAERRDGDTGGDGPGDGYRWVEPGEKLECGDERLGFCSRPAEWCRTIGAGAILGESQRHKYRRRIANLDAAPAAKDEELVSLQTFRAAVEHVTENGNTKRSVSASEGWAVVHKDRLIDLEIAEERLTKSQPMLTDAEHKLEVSRGTIARQERELASLRDAIQRLAERLVELGEGLLLTAAEREALAECLEICESQLQSAIAGEDEETIAHWQSRVVTLRGLLLARVKPKEIET